MPKKPSNPEHIKAELEKVVNWARERGKPYDVHNNGNQVKVGVFNLYLSNGTINRDGNLREPVKGADAFIKLIEEEDKARDEALIRNIQRLRRR